MDATQVYEKIKMLSKFEKYKNGKLSQKGMLKTSLDFKEYKRRLDEVVVPLCRLDGAAAAKLSATIKEKYPDAPSMISKMKLFSLSVEDAEAKNHQPKTNAEGEVESYILYADTVARFERLEAVFTGERMGELYSDEVHQRQCEEIEMLLEGKSAESRKRDVGQEREIGELIELLCRVIGSKGTGAPLLTARGAPPTARGAGEVPETARRIDSRPKCLTAPIPGEPIHTVLKSSRKAMDSARSGYEQSAPGPSHVLSPRVDNQMQQQSSQPPTQLFSA